MERPSIVVWVCVISIITSFTGGCSASPFQGELVSSPNREVQAEAGRPTYWPGDDWRISTPEEQELNSTLILELLQTIQKRNLAIHSLLIIRHGYLVTEVYFPPYQREVPHPAFSATKSVTSTLVGIAIEVTLKVCSRRFWNIKAGTDVAGVVSLINQGAFPILGSIPGFKTAYVMHGDDNTFAAISIFADRAAAEQSNTLILDWLRQNLGPMLAGPPETMVGEVVAHQ